MGHRGRDHMVVTLYIYLWTRSLSSLKM